MKNTMMNLIVAATLLIGGTALASVESGKDSSLQARKTPSLEAKPVAIQPVATPAAAPAPASVAASAATPKSTPAAPAQKFQPSPKKLNTINPAKAGSARSKSLDLRHCLDLETSAAIAKCAGE